MSDHLLSNCLVFSALAQSLSLQRADHLVAPRHYGQQALQQLFLARLIRVRLVGLGSRHHAAQLVFQVTVLLFQALLAPAENKSSP